jgi:hypothetical protein
MGRIFMLLDPQDKLPPLVTPALVIPTEIGLIPHLTPDASPNIPLFFSAGDFLEHALPSGCPLPISLGLGPRWSFLGLAADFNNFDEGPTSKGIKIFCRNGVSKVIGPEEYRALVDAFAARAVISLHSRIFPNASGRQIKLRTEAAKTLLESYSGCLNFADGSVDSLNHGLFLQYGTFTPEDKEKAKEIIKGKDKSLGRIIFFDGHPSEVRDAVEIGFDLFVLKMPVLCAEKGLALNFGFAKGDCDGELGIDLRCVEFANDHRPLVADCDCECCREFFRSYVHHLLNVHEMLGEVLLVKHNLRHYERFFEAIREELSVA